MDGQGTTWRRNIAENFNRLSRVRQRYRRQTTDRRTADDAKITFAKKLLKRNYNNKLHIVVCRKVAGKEKKNNVTKIKLTISGIQQRLKIIHFR